MDTELVQRVAELRQEGRSPKEVARVLGLRPADVMPVIRAVAAQAPEREAPVAGCWVTGHWSGNLGVTEHPDWPGLPAGESESGESGLVGCSWPGTPAARSWHAGSWLMSSAWA